AALLATAACSSNTVDRGDAEKCLAGEVFKEGIGCVPAGCSQNIHCDDGNPCNGLEECIGGRCSRGGVVVESCDDGIGCTHDQCDRVLADCIHVVDDELCQDWEQCHPQEDCIGRVCSGDLSCSDDLYCNGVEVCVDGECIAGKLNCDDPVPCTADSCSEDADKCQHIPEHDACPSGQICNPEQGCIELPCETDEYCDDGSHCNGEEKCASGKCIGGLPVICDDRVDCTIDRCDETARGCVHAADHSLCNDDLFCNGVESCDANTGCVVGASVVCRDTVNCTVDSCNEELDACQYTPQNSHCASTEICDPLNDCVARPECLTDSDCPGGMECVNETCIGTAEEPQPMDGDDGGMGDDGADDGGMGDDGYGDDGYGDDGYGDDGCCAGDDGGDDGCCMGDDGGMPGDDGGDGECEEGSTRQCDTGVPGVCGLGMDHCQGGVWTGCVQVTTAQPEKCDGLDNDCDGAPDDEDVCACLTGCKDIEVCDIAGGENCEEAAGFLNACILRCDNDWKCPPTTDAIPRVCVDVPVFGLGPVCMCEPSQCPQLCQIDRDCYPFGLTYCMAGSCTSPCGSSRECPPPYLCNSTQGMCECDTGNIGDSCLGCGTDFDCNPLAPCTYRQYETDPATIFKECEYPCSTDEQCPSILFGDPLYCRWGEGNTPERCACAPETACMGCEQMEPDLCEPYSMDCMTIPDPVGGANEITGCTAPCQSHDHCPDGWYCWDDGLSTNGWCIETGCHCMDVECGPNGIPANECGEMFPGFSCILDTLGDPGFELCTMYCMTAFDCPLGYHCDDGSGTAGMPVCRCSQSTEVGP
ncbi:hypothetical protein ACFL2F_03835, partial [Myxococcota bacterium]